MPFDCKGKNANERLPGLHNGMHALAIVVGDISYYPPVQMHLWVQDTLIEKIQEACATKSSMALSVAHKRRSDER